MANILIHVKYKVGTREAIIRNVDLDELQTLLKTLSDEKKKRLDTILGIKGDVDDVEKHLDMWVNELMQTYKLVLNENGATCSFFDKFWQGKTPAKVVFCLIENAIQAQEKVEKQIEQRKLDAEIQKTLEPRVPLPASAYTVTDAEVDKWLERYRNRANY